MQIVSKKAENMLAVLAFIMSIWGAAFTPVELNFKVLLGLVSISVVLVIWFWDYLLGENVKKKLGAPCKIEHRIQYYLSRDDLPIKDVIDLAMREIIFVSVTHELAAPDERNLIREAIVNRNITVKILVLNPKADLKYQEKVFGVPLQNRIQDSIITLCRLKDELKEDAKKLIIQTYNNNDFPYSLILVDHIETNGTVNDNAFIKIEEHPLSSAAFNRPNKAVFRNDNGYYYRGYYEDYSKLSLDADDPCKIL